MNPISPQYYKLGDTVFFSGNVGSNASGVVLGILVEDSASPPSKIFAEQLVSANGGAFSGSFALTLGIQGEDTIIVSATGYTSASQTFFVTASTWQILETSVKVQVNSTSEIKVQLNYQSDTPKPITQGVVIGELLTNSTVPTPIAILYTSPILLPNYNSTGYYLIDYSPQSGIAPGHYVMWFFIWNQLPSQSGDFQAYMSKIVVDIMVS